MWRLLLRVLRHPVAPIVLVVVLAGDVACISLRHQGFLGPAPTQITSSVGQVFSRIVGKRSVSLAGGIDTSVVATHSSHTGKVTIQLNPDLLRAGRPFLSFERTRFYPGGFYAPTTRSRAYSITYMPKFHRLAGEPWPPKPEHFPILSAFLDALVVNGTITPTELAHVRPFLVSTNPEGLYSVAYWPGYAHNALTLVMLGSLFGSVFLVWRDKPWRMWLWRGGRCLRCGYSLVGLPESAGVCPECGGRIEK